MVEPARPPSSARRLVYLGTPEAAVAPLRALVDAGFEIALVVSRPDRRRGRGGALSPSPVKAAATELGLTVTDALDDVLGVDADLGVVVAYGRIIPSRILEQLPMINLHFSLLPRWRGAAPVERALLAGDIETGVCVMDVDVELDTGAVHAVARTPIGPEDSAASLRSRLSSMGAELLVDTLRAGLGRSTPQQGEVTYAAKIDPSELCIEWSAPATDIDRLVRVGGAYSTFRGTRLKVHAVRPVEHGSAPPGTLDGLVVVCGAGAVELVEVQPEGRARQSARDWVNGTRPTPDERLGR